MSEHFSTDYKAKARERAAERQDILDLNRQDAADRGIGPNHFGNASSSVGNHRSDKWINGKQVQGQPVPQGRALQNAEPQKFEPYLQPDPNPVKDNGVTHHKPSVFNNRRQNHMGWEYSHNRPPIEPTPEPKTTKRGRKS